MSDDRLKEKFMDVNAFWSQYKVVIYTPTIDAGVDFNIRDYFDRMYCFLSSGSTQVTPRGFLQMTGRIDI